MTQTSIGTPVTKRRGIAPLVALAAVVGPGLIAGLSDDDPAGITTYSVLGASYGYRLLWVLLVSTVALILFQDLGARIGVVTGQGLAGLIRQRYGARAGMLSISALLLANIGTTTAEFAGIAAGGEIFGIPRWVSVPIGAIVVSVLVLRGGFRGVERVLLALSAIFLAYIGAGLLSKPDWGAAFQGLVTPTLPPTRDALLLATATLGTTLAPWGLAFIQSYAVDKKINPQQLKLLRIDVISGAVLTGVVGFFVVVSCAATLHRNGIAIDDASSAARALEPLAGHLAAQRRPRHEPWNHSPDIWRRSCSRSAWSAPHCSPRRSCPCPPPTRYVTWPDAPQDLMTASGKHRCSTERSALSPLSAPDSCSSPASRSYRSSSAPR